MPCWKFQQRSCVLVCLFKNEIYLSTIFFSTWKFSFFALFAFFSLFCYFQQFFLPSNCWFFSSEFYILKEIRHCKIIVIERHENYRYRSIFCYSNGKKIILQLCLSDLLGKSIEKLRGNTIKCTQKNYRRKICSATEYILLDAQ